MKQQILFRENDAQCCGCGACEAVCPVNAIEMVPKEFGALYPRVDTQKCIGCRQCERVCVYRTKTEENSSQPSVFAASCKNVDLLKKSASGGVFASLAEHFIADGGVVYGCSMELLEDKLVPVHVGIKNTGDLYKLQGSKYVQSKASPVFPEIRELLQKGRPILFSGTPCQVAALKCFLKGIDTDKLYTMDLVCHGTPGTAFFQDYIGSLEKRKDRKITAFSFRDKHFGWGLTASYDHVTGGGKVKKQLLSPEICSYYSLFLRAETYRQSCYSCPWAKQQRIGDITIGDYWGIEAEHPECLQENGGHMVVQQGISAALVNTDKGRELLDHYGNELVLEPSELQKVARWNRQLNGPSSHTEERNIILQHYRENGYAGVEKYFRRKLGLRYYVRLLKNKLRK